MLAWHSLVRTEGPNPLGEWRGSVGLEKKHEAVFHPVTAQPRDFSLILKPVSRCSHRQLQCFIKGLNINLKKKGRMKITAHSIRTSWGSEAAQSGRHQVHPTQWTPHRVREGMADPWRGLTRNCVSSSNLDNTAIFKTMWQRRSNILPKSPDKIWFYFH